MPFSIQKSLLRAVDESAARELIAQEERWWVERKQEAHIEALAAEIASFANSDGGWLLVNIADHGETPMQRLPQGATAKLLSAPQDWLGQTLIGRLDPMPAFEATTVQLNGAPLCVIRVPRSPLAPVLPTDTGVLYERGPAGKLRIARVDRVRELVARRDHERRLAEARLDVPSALPEVDRRLGIPNASRGHTADQLAVFVRATPLAFEAEAFEPVALGESAPDEFGALLPDLLVSFGHRAFGNAREQLLHGSVGVTVPMQRGFVMKRRLAIDLGHGDHLEIAAACVADAGGAVAVRLDRRQTLSQMMPKHFAASHVRDEWLLPALGFLAGQILGRGPAGPLLFDLWITGLADWELDWDLQTGAVQRRAFGRDGSRTWIQAGAEAELTIAELRRANAEGSAHPLQHVAARWTRDLAREAGFAVYEQAY